MNNTFLFHSAFLGGMIGMISRASRKLLSVEIKQVPSHKDMLTLEQSVNIRHFIEQLVTNGVAGDFVEFGCYTGQSALFIQQTIQQNDPSRKFHVYDTFEIDSKKNIDIRETFIRNFQKADLPLPDMHAGDVRQALPIDLPESLAFVHIDLTVGSKQNCLRDLIFYCLQSVYNRMAPGAICLIMDYHDRAKTLGGIDQFPELKQACDAFFADKPEKMSVLYGGHYSHGYFRKASRLLQP